MDETMNAKQKDMKAFLSYLIDKSSSHVNYKKYLLDNIVSMNKSLFNRLK